MRRIREFIAVSVTGRARSMATAVSAACYYSAFVPGINTGTR